tara:strand:+ start:141 stop:410 length:270 start_codon:yes stop_codon:yes gene_type:complete
MSISKDDVRMEMLEESVKYALSNIYEMRDFSESCESLSEGMVILGLFCGAVQEMFENGLSTEDIHKLTHAVMNCDFSEANSFGLSDTVH